MELSKKTLERMKALTELHGAPGFEDKVRNYMKAELSVNANEIIQDGLGGIFAVKKSKKKNAPKVLVAAHMDEVGFMVTELADNGFIKFTPLGGWPTDVLLSQRFSVRTTADEEITGVIGSVPVHFRRGDNKETKIEDMLLDVGADSKEELLEMGINLGDSIVPKVDFQVLKNEKKLLAKAWDNRYGCLIAIEALESLKDTELDCDLYIGANVQEEVGLRGAKASANMINPDIAFVVDCSPANDMMGKKDDLGKIGEGTLLRLFDRTMILAPKMREFLLDTAQESDVKYQYYHSPGGTDAGSIHVSKNGVPSAVVGICSRYIHTANSIINYEDYFHAHNLLTSLIKNVNNETLDRIRG